MAEKNRLNSTTEAHSQNRAPQRTVKM